MSRETQSEAALVKRMESVVKMLENLFILEAAKAGIKRDAIRDLLGVRAERVSAIMKHLKNKQD